jgi:hypothetical protein
MAEGGYSYSWMVKERFFSFICLFIKNSFIQYLQDTALGSQIPEVPALLFIPSPGKQFCEGTTVIPPAAH